MTDSRADLDLREPDLTDSEMRRLRDIFAELAKHGESRKLLQRSGVDEGELAEACDVVVRFLDARILERLRARAASGARPK